MRRFFTVVMLLITVATVKAQDAQSTWHLIAFENEEEIALYNTEMITAIETTVQSVKIALENGKEFFHPLATTTFGFDPRKEGAGTSIENITDPHWGVFYSNGKLHFSKTVKNITVYSMTGVLVAQFAGNRTEVSVHLTSGIYIVQAEGKVTKLAIDTRGNGSAEAQSAIGTKTVNFHVPISLRVGNTTKIYWIISANNSTLSVEISNVEKFYFTADNSIALTMKNGDASVVLDYQGSEFSDEEYCPVEPLFDYSTVAFIARITENSADWSLCTIDSSGNGMRKIVDKTVACQKPERSHFGTKLMFKAVKFDYWTNADNSVGMSAEYELYIVNSDGTNLTLIDRIDKTESGNFGNFAWSPNDSQIVYTKLTYHSGWSKSDLILYNILDSTHTIIPTEGNVCVPKFSPDGKQIAYCSTIENEHNIYKMDVDGNNNQLIIKNAASPKWSPQGDKIVYSSSGIDRSSQIYVANADGSNQKQLTSSVSPGWWDTGFPRDGNSDPQWSPDGKKIVYVSFENEKSEIFIMNVDGGKKTRLTNATSRDRSPEITPDGKFIVSESMRDDMNWGISIMTINGNNQKVISITGAYPVACK